MSKRPRKPPKREFIIPPKRPITVAEFQVHHRVVDDFAEDPPRRPYQPTARLPERPGGPRSLYQRMILDVPFPLLMLRAFIVFFGLPAMIFVFGLAFGMLRTAITGR